MEGKIARLKGCVQHYAWGGLEYIPALLNLENLENQPCAEYWMGAHPSACSSIELDGKFRPLEEFIKNDPATYIGNNTLERFGELPFLFKILDVREMLSIQVHPTKPEAVKGFEREEAAGIALNAGNRNYKDRNHKPEIMVALSEFYLLHGFKPEEEFEETLVSVPEFNILLDCWKQQGYFGVYKLVMELDQQKADEILLPLVERELAKTSIAKTDPAYWVRKLYNDAIPANSLDKGIFSIYFFNILKASPGQGVFQQAGLPHAYLEGHNVELMANSDNVLRGGLTPKHVDVPELLKHIAFEATHPNIIQAVPDEHGVINYPAPVDDFALNALVLAKGKTIELQSTSAEIFIVISGTVLVKGLGNINKGDSIFITPEVSYSIEAIEDSLLYKAFVPA